MVGIILGFLMMFFSIIEHALKNLDIEEAI
jgi:hypothetical protein